MQNDKTQTIREQIAKLVDEYAALALAAEPFFPGVTAVPPSGKLLDAELGTKIAFTVGLALAGSLLALFVTYKLAMHAVSRTDQDMPWRTKASIAAAEAQAEAEAANTGAGNPTAGPGSAISPGNQPGD